ncbi:hypothetical protein RJ640_001523 [Escallonia rubra]|uniref:Fe2OG dioxygenase domain-containing protein n=1 Tax=Escallonia rubra TaxID=112253 RepID=A0AA88Q9F6_9ASTE|nr:hypothetical protein RJ640_001523 [Escallonia rubra]
MSSQLFAEGQCLTTYSCTLENWEVPCSLSYYWRLLGSNQDTLKAWNVQKNAHLCDHYYPACPRPELTLGVRKHADPLFLTVLMQDEIGGLQVLHENQWVDVPPIRGGFVVNIRNFLQLSEFLSFDTVSNDKFKSNKHRVLANRIGPRISVPCFLNGPVPSSKLYGLIKELISEGNPTPYREVQLDKYIAKFLSTGLDEYQGLDDYYRGKKILQGD